jgi:uncharacterized protein DUF1931
MIAAVQSSKRPSSPCHERGKIRAILPDRGEARCRQAGPRERCSDFINRKVYDLLVRAEDTAKANDRVIIEPFDLPITKGLKESIHEFTKIDEQIELQPILYQLAARPPLDLAYGEDTEAGLPEVMGGLSVALARAFKIIDGGLKNPATVHWQKCFRIFDLLM